MKKIKICSLTCRIILYNDIYTQMHTCGKKENGLFGRINATMKKRKRETRKQSGVNESNVR